jgi:hypothetical protein
MLPADRTYPWELPGEHSAECYRVKRHPGAQRGEGIRRDQSDVECAKKHGGPFLVVALDNKPQVADVLAWLELHGIKTLNVAGPRESKCLGVYRQALNFLR